MSFATLKPTLISAQRLEQDYLAKRQTVALERLKEIQRETAKHIVRNLLDRIIQECKSVDGFLSEAVIELLADMKKTKCPNAQ